MDAWGAYDIDRRMLCCLRLRWAWEVVGVVFGTCWVVSSDSPSVENGWSCLAT
jgi:hypothetical protein